MKQVFKNSPLILFIVSSAILLFLYGVAVGKYEIPPYGTLVYAYQGFQRIFPNEKAFYIRKARDPSIASIKNTGKAYEGINLVTRINSDLELLVEVTSLDGDLINRWELDWFDLWPAPDHLPPVFAPKSRPGTHIHGAILLDDGDLIFNFESLGLIRIDPHGNVVWRLPYQTHHSIHIHDDGNLWVCGHRERLADEVDIHYKSGPYDEYTILVVSPDGEIIKEWSVPEILKQNDRGGLIPLGHEGMSMNTIGDPRQDLLHLNDVEPFPLTMEEGFFNKNDVLVSLRNVNTVFVFNRETMKIKYITTGMFDWQHDPDFMDSDRFSVYDNNKDSGYSRIVIVSGKENTMTVYYEGSDRQPFFSRFMGKHQWLPNGNLLVTESLEGRAFEINDAKEVVWEYTNFVGNGKIGLVQEVQRYPLNYGRIYSKNNVKKE